MTLKNTTETHKESPALLGSIIWPFWKPLKCQIPHREGCVSSECGSSRRSQKPWAEGDQHRCMTGTKRAWYSLDKRLVSPSWVHVVQVVGGAEGPSAGVLSDPLTLLV